MHEVDALLFALLFHFAARAHSLLLRACSRRAGAMRMIHGKLQSSSIDVYLALEHCAAGDLHALQGQMAPAMVQSLLSQLVAGVQYLHDLHVWHRDLKSANLLLKMHEGVQTVKIADLGARAPPHLYATSMCTYIVPECRESCAPHASPGSYERAG
jgi:serine/threonine protein kinase